MTPEVAEELKRACRSRGNLPVSQAVRQAVTDWVAGGGTLGIETSCPKCGCEMVIDATGRVLRGGHSGSQAPKLSREVLRLAALIENQRQSRPDAWLKALEALVRSS